MYRDGRDSSDYSAPPGPSSRRRDARSPSPPRGRRQERQERGYSTSGGRGAYDRSRSARDSVGHLNGYQQQMEELHCEVCDVHAGSRAQMQQHLDGARHQKKIKPVEMFKCYLCHVEVTSQSTLNIHKMGKDHIKREKQLAEQRKKRGDYNANDKDKVGPMENTEEELKRLRVEVKNLRAKVKEYQEKNQKCIREHGNMEDFRKYKDYYLDNHIRPEELARGGLYVPKLNY